MSVPRGLSVRKRRITPRTEERSHIAETENSGALTAPFGTIYGLSNFGSDLRARIIALVTQAAAANSRYLITFSSSQSRSERR